MNILVTGAAGFFGKNLVCALKNLRDGKDRTRPDLVIGTIWEYDIDTPEQVLEEAASGADFVFNLAGVNRPQNNDEFMKGNFGFGSRLLDMLVKSGNKCPVMLSSSVQASLAGRYAGSPYGESKLAGENLFFDYSEKEGIPVYVYRFTNLFGKWCRPNYNSAVATFCNNIANDLPIRVDNPDTLLTLCYIDDAVKEMLDLLEGRPHRCDYEGVEPVENTSGKFCFVPVTHDVTLGEITSLLYKFASQPDTLVMPEIPDRSFAKKLYSTYLSYLPYEKIAYVPKMNCDARGSFTELLKTEKCGQFSVNISKPGVTKGQHWHNTKWEFFAVVSGHGRIEMREIGTDKVLTFDVDGNEIKMVHMLPGYTHNIINLSDTDDLVTLMWANEIFDPSHPDTFGETV